jgi:hypothetical protein
MITKEQVIEIAKDSFMGGNRNALETYSEVLELTIKAVDSKYTLGLELALQLVQSLINNNLEGDS